MLLQTSHSQVRSLGPADACGTVRTQGRDRKVVKALTEISFPCQAHTQSNRLSVRGDSFLALKTHDKQTAGRDPHQLSTTQIASSSYLGCRVYTSYLQYPKSISPSPLQNLSPGRAVPVLSLPEAHTHRQGHYSHGNTSCGSYLKG